MKEIEIKTQRNVNVYVSEWDDGGAWLRLGFRHGSVHTPLTRKETEQLLQGLQEILAKEVVHDQ